MKKLLLFALVFILLLPGCTKDDTAASTAPGETTALSQEKIDSYVGEGLMTILRSLTDAAIYSANNIFEYGSLPCAKDAKPVIKDGRSYLPVASDKINTYSELEAYLDGCFTKEVADGLLKSKKYIDIDGVLHCESASYTPNETVVFDSYTLSVEEKTADSASLVITAANSEGKAVTLILPAVCKGGAWRLTGTVDIGKAVNKGE